MEYPTSSTSLIIKVIMVFAGLVVGVAGLMQAKAVLVPFMMAVLVVVITRGPINWLQEKGSPKR